MKTLTRTLAIISAFFAMLFIGGCSKKDAGPVNGNVKKITREITNAGRTASSKSSTVFTFDEQNRTTLVQMYDGTGNANGKTVITYATNSLTFASFDSAGNGQYTGVATLNTQGLVTDINGGSTTYTYDKDGHLLAENDGNGSSQANTYINGNLDVNVSTGNGYSDITRYTYLTAKTDYRNMGPYFMGKGNKNLVNTEIQTPIPDQRIHSYEYDSQGRVSKETIASSVSIEVDSFTYFD